jgi:hypothetical protein
MMPFEFACNQCGTTLRVGESQIGSILNCPACGQVIFVQSPAAESAAPIGVARPDAAAPSPADAAAPNDAAAAAEAQSIPLAAESPSDVGDFLKSLAGSVPPELETREGPTELMAADNRGSPFHDLFAGEPQAMGTIALPESPEFLLSPGADDTIQQEPPAAPFPFAELTGESAEPESASPDAPNAEPDSPRADDTLDLPWLAPATPFAESPVATQASIQPPVPAATNPLDFLSADNLNAMGIAVAPEGDSSGLVNSAPVVPVASVPVPAPVAVAANEPTSAELPDFLAASAPPAPGPAVTSHDLSNSTTTAVRRPAAKSGSRFGVAIFAYVSGVLMGLILGKVLFGRSQAASAPTGLEMIRDDGAQKGKTKWPNPKSEVPRGQISRIGETVEVGALAVTAKAVERSKVTKVHSFSQTKEQSRDKCLVLRLVLKNISKDIQFAPLDPIFLRPHDPRNRPNYSYIQLKDANPIPMFELDKFSEFDLDGQPFDALEPGEEIEAIVAAAEGSPAQAKGNMLWRVQVRAGVREGHSYSTVVGFEFAANEIAAE